MRSSSTKRYNNTEVIYFHCIGFFTLGPAVLATGEGELRHILLWRQYTAPLWPHCKVAWGGTDSREGAHAVACEGSRCFEGPHSEL